MFDYDTTSDVLLGHQQNGDPEFFEFLENEMPTLFPEINKQLETKKTRAVEESIVVPTDRGLDVYPLSATNACSSPSVSPSPTQFVPISPLSEKGISEEIKIFNVPNPLAHAVSTLEEQIVSAPVSPSPSAHCTNEPARKKRRISICSVVSTSSLSTNTSELNDDEIEEEKR